MTHLNEVQFFGFVLKYLWIFSLVTISLLFSITIADAYAEEVISSQQRHIPIHFDNLKPGDGIISGNHKIVITYDKLYAIDFEKSKLFIDNTWQARTLISNQGFHIDESVQLKGVSKNQYNISDPVAILTEDRYKEWKYPEESRKPIITPKDENAAPSMGGQNNRENFRFTFANVVEQPTFTTTCTTIFIHNGQATDRYVGVFLDGNYIGSIDLKRDLKEGEILGFGGQFHDIPFEKCFYVTPEGQLILHERGYQHVWRDLNGMEIFHQDKDDGQPSRIVSQDTLDAKMKLAYYLR